MNTTTSNIIEQTRSAKQNSAPSIRARLSTIGCRVQNAFSNIYATMDSIDQFKMQALDNMAQTIGVLEQGVEVPRYSTGSPSRPASRLRLDDFESAGPGYPLHIALTAAAERTATTPTGTSHGFLDWLPGSTTR